MSLLTCANNLKGNDYAVDFLQTTISKRMSYKRDYYISVNDEHVVITKNANTPFEVVAEDMPLSVTLIK